MFRDVPGIRTEVAQQRGERLRGGERGHAGGGAVQVDVELTVGETFPQLMGHVQGQRALADAGHTADHRDGRGRSGRLGQRAVQLAAHIGTAGEVGGRGGELGRTGGLPYGGSVAVA